MTYQLPPLIDADTFEKLVRDILRLVYEDPGIEQFGRRGQNQHGIDGYSPTVSDITFQCKLKDLRYESEKNLREVLTTEMVEEFGKTKDLTTRPKRFIFASTFKNDTHLQQKAKSISTIETIVEYWGWDTINEKIWDYAETLIPIFFPQCPIKHTPGFRKITIDDIQKALIDDPDRRKKLALEYYRINDRDDVVFKVVCNKMDIRNTDVVENALQKLKKYTSSRTFWILGNGGSGKTTILHRLAVELSLSGQNVYMLNFEANLNRSDLENVLSQIKYCNATGKVLLCIDNPAQDEEALGLLLRLIPDYCEQINILIAERGHRYHAMQKNGCMTYLHGEEEHDPIIVRNSRKQRQQVYNKLFELLGIADDDTTTLREIGLNERLAYVNATYTILLELKKKRKIDFDFDWDDYRKLTIDIPSFQGGYKYIALFYLFGVKMPFSLLSKILHADEVQQRIFLEKFRGLEYEPVVVDERRDVSGRKNILLRTKHEIVSEVYFREHHNLEKTELLMECCEHTDFRDLLHSQALVNIFGTKKNYLIEDYHVNYQSIFDYLFNSYLVDKVKLSQKLYATLHLAKFWLLLSQDKDDEAVSLLELFIQEVPDNLHTRTELAKIYQKQNKLDKAEAVLQKLLEIDKKNLQARTELAKIYQKQNKLDKAEAVLQKLLEIDKKNLQARTELAKIYQKQNKLDKAEAVLQKLLEIDQKDLQARTELAKIYQKQNMLDKAEAVLQKLLEIDQKDLQARTELSKIYQRQGKLTDAEVVLLEVLDIKIDDLNSRTELAKIYQKQNMLDKAEAVLQKLLEIDKKNLQARTELSKIYQRQGKLTDAEVVLLEVLDIKIDDLNSRTELAKIYQRQGKLTDAEVVLLEVLDIKIDDLNSRTELAKIYQKQNKLDKAEALLLESLKIDDKQLHPRTELSKIYQKQNKLDKAEALLLESLKIDDKQLHPRTELSKIYQKQNKLDKAEALLLESLKIDDKQLHPRTELAKIYQKQNKLDKAEVVLQKLLDIDKKNLQARTELAKIYQKQNKLDKAEALLLESLKIDNKQLHPRTELAKIYQRQNKLDKAEALLLESLKIDNKQLHPRTELAKIYQRQNKLDKAAEKAEESLEIDPLDIYAMSELLAIWNRQGKNEKCVQRFFEFIAQPEYHFDRHSQAPVFRFFLCCRDFKMKENAREVFQRFSQELDERNLNFYRDNFE